MIKKRKNGVILILIGIGILFVFSIYEDDRGYVEIEWDGYDITLPYIYPLVIGVILVLVGIGKVIFSFFPKEAKSKK